MRSGELLASSSAAVRPTVTSSRFWENSLIDDLQAKAPLPAGNKIIDSYVRTA